MEYNLLPIYTIWEGDDYMNKTGGNFMAYSIVEYPATSFIDNRSIQLPRFQRKQTWKADDNFKLCISVFKGTLLG